MRYTSIFLSNSSEMRLGRGILVDIRLNHLSLSRYSSLSIQRKKEKKYLKQMRGYIFTSYLCLMSRTCLSRSSLAHNWTYQSHGMLLKNILASISLEGQTCMTISNWLCTYLQYISFTKLYSLKFDTYTEEVLPSGTQIYLSKVVFKALIHFFL